MPVKVVRRPVRSGKNFAIVEAATGKVKGRSKTRRAAEASARARNSAKRRK